MARPLHVRARVPARAVGPRAVRLATRNPTVPHAGGPVLLQERGGGAVDTSGVSGEAFPFNRARVSRVYDRNRRRRLRTSQGRRGRDAVFGLRRLPTPRAHHVHRGAPAATFASR